VICVTYGSETREMDLFCDECGTPIPKLINDDIVPKLGASLLAFSPIIIRLLFLAIVSIFLCVIGWVNSNHLFGNKFDNLFLYVYSHGFSLFMSILQPIIQALIHARIISYAILPVLSYVT